MNLGTTYNGVYGAGCEARYEAVNYDDIRDLLLICSHPEDAA